MSINKLDIKEQIKKIYHISDIHINLYKKHDEYLQVFQNFQSFIENEIEENDYNGYEAIVVVTGDILHSKTELSPECVQLTYDFFDILAQMIPIIIIAGNHDANLSNKNRLDALSPIIGSLDANPDIPFHYFKDTGIYEMNNISFGVTSVFDYQLLKASQIPNRKDCIKIALYHGRVNGAITDTGIVLEGEEITDTDSDSDFEYDPEFDPMMVDESMIEQIEYSGIEKNKIVPKSFAGYDYVLMGDIHKHQYLNKERTIAYAGSLIQQNHGENMRGHGVLCWNLENGESHLYEIPNSYGYYTLRIKDYHDTILNCCLPNMNMEYHLQQQMEITTLKKVVKDGKTIYKKIKDEYYHNEKCSIPSNVRLRIEYGELTYAQQEKLVSLVRLNHNILETQFKPLEETVDENQSEGHKISFNVKDVSCQNDFLDKYFSTRVNKKDSVTNDELEKIKKLNVSLNENLTTETSEHLNWKLCKLEFDNMFSYNTGNVIDFTKCSGVVGIIAPNHTGKSSIIDIIMYCLFNKFSRKGDIKDIINVRCNSFRAYLIFQIENRLYHIEKKGTYSNSRNKRTSELPISVDFYRTNLNGEHKEDLKGIKPKDTMNRILEYVGSYDDMILTSVSLQGNNTNFIDITDTPRKNEMEKLLKIGIFTDLKEKASKEINDKKSVFKYLKSLNILEDITNKMKEMQEKKVTFKQLKNVMEDLENKYNKINGKIERIRKNVSKFENQSNTELWKDIINKFKVNNIGFQIPQNDLDKFRKDNEELVDLYQIYDMQWKNINQIDKLDWVSVQKHLTELKEILMSFITNLEARDKELMNQIEDEYNDNESISEMKTELGLGVEKLSKLHSNLIPLDDINIDDCQKEINDISEKQQKKYEELDNIPNIENEIKDQLEKAIQSLDDYNELIIETEENRDNLMERLQSNQNDIMEEHKNKIYELINELCEEEMPIDDWRKKLMMIKDIVEHIGIDTDLMKNIDELNIKLKKCHKKVKKYQKLKSEKSKEESDILKDKQTLNHTIQQLDWKHESLQKNLNSYQKNIEINRKINNRKKKNTKLENKIRMYELHEIYSSYGMSAVGLINCINKFLSKIKNQEGDYVRYRSLNKELEETEKQYQKIVNDRDRTKEAYYQMKSDIKQGAHDLTELSKKREEIQELELEIKLYQNYLEAVKNIPYMLIQNIKPKLEQMINEMLSTLVDFTIYFDIKDNKQFSIYIKRESEKHRREILLSNASGFEKFIGGLFIRIALINISNLPKGNFLFIDEGWGCFDGNNINNVGLIFDYLKNKFDFILTISHLQELRQHLNQQIILKKDSQNWSHVEY